MLLRRAIAHCQAATRASCARHYLIPRKRCPAIRSSLYYESTSQHPQARCFSEIPGGADLLGDADASSSEERPKIVLEAYAPTGFDVSNMIQRVEREEDAEQSGEVHMTGSILAFPRACFFWKISNVSEITLESLAPVVIHRPPIKYLFLGSNTPIPPQTLQTIKKELKSKAGIVAEQLTLRNAMGTFNILNGEERNVAAALILDTDDEQ